MPRIEIEPEGDKRRVKICPQCKSYVPETVELEGECNVGEDIEDTEFCGMFDNKWKGKKIWRKSK